MKKVSLYVLSFFYVMAGFNHFMNPDIYLKMMPSYLPAPTVLNAIAGGAEMLLGMMLIRPEVRSLAAWGVILLLIAVFPANISMLSQGGAAYGLPDWALIVRLPVQLLLIGWAYWHTKNPDCDIRVVETEIEIEASAGSVWRELMAFERYPEWNPFIVKAKGTGALGERMEISIRQPDGAEFNFKNVIIENEKAASFAWRGSFIVRGLFDGTHYFRLEQTGKDSTKLIHGELFEGVLVGLLSSLLGNTKRGFAAMNVALKARVEKL